MKRAALSLCMAACFVSIRSAIAANIEEVDLLIKDSLYAQAIARLDKDLASKPKDLDLLLRKGICQSMLCRFDDARGTFNYGLSIDPKEPRFLHNLGLLCMREKKFDEAERYFKQTLAVRPWHPETNFHLGVICEGRGESKKALAYYTTELNYNARCARAWQRWYALKGAGGAENHVSLRLILFAVGAAVAGLFVLFRQKKSDDEEIECAD